MIRRRSIFVRTTLLFLVVLVLTALGSQAEATSAAPALQEMAGWEVAPGRSVRASEVLGFGVRNLEGDNIGEVDDVVVNIGSDQILFVTMRYDGGLFQSESIYPVPVSAFSWDANSQELTLDLDEAALEDAPGFDSDWPDPSDPEFDVEIYDYWRNLFPELPAPAETTAADDVAKVSNIMGLDVIGSSDEDLGEIDDVILNVDTEALSALVISFTGLFGPGGNQYVLPSTAFTVAGDDGLRVPMSSINLQYGPTFSAFVELNNPDWSEPYQRWWQRMQRYSEQEVTPLTLSGTTWQVESAYEPGDGMVPLPGTRQTLNFAFDLYSGSGGCNWFQGAYGIFPDHTMRLQTPAYSHVLCDPIGINNQESTYISLLLNILEYDLVDDKLIGYTIGDQRLLTFVPAEPVSFETTTWLLKFIQNNDQWYSVINGSETSALFEGDQVSGSSGCNSYSATVSGEGENLTISDIEVTEELCTEPAGIMEQEANFLAALEATSGAEQVGGALKLMDDAGRPLLYFGSNIEPDALPTADETMDETETDDSSDSTTETSDTAAEAGAITSETEIGEIVGQNYTPLVTISPDGSMLAWVNSEGRFGNRVGLLCIHNLASAEQNCTEVPDQFHDAPYQLAWSPDSSQIAFSENPVQLANESDIWLFDVNNATFLDATDDGVEGFYEALEDGTYLLDYLPMWNFSDGALYFWRVDPLGERQFDIGIYQLVPGEEEAQLVRDLSDEIEGRLPLMDTEQFYMDGVAVISPDGSQVAVILSQLGGTVPTIDYGLWLIDLTDSSVAPQQLATMEDFQSAVPSWQSIPAIPYGLSWLADGSGVVVTAYSAVSSNPLHVFYYAGLEDGTFLPVVDFSGVESWEGMYEVAPDSNLVVRQYSPWTGALSPVGNQLLMYNDLANAAGLLAADLPPDGSLPVVVYQSEETSDPGQTRSSRSLDNQVIIGGVLYTMEP